MELEKGSSSSPQKPSLLRGLLGTLAVVFAISFWSKFNTPKNPPAKSIPPKTNPGDLSTKERPNDKNKKNKQRVNPIPLPPLQPPPAQTVSRQKVGAVAIASIVIGIISLPSLNQEFPRPTATAQLPTNQDEPISSSRFTITNSGLMKLADVKATCFLWKVFYSANGPLMSSELITGVSPKENILEAAEPLTVPCENKELMEFGRRRVPMTHADLAIVVYYRPWPIPFLRCHRLFRFVARFGDKGQILAWDAQPAKPLEQDFDKAIKTLNSFAKYKRYPVTEP